ESDLGRGHAVEALLDGCYLRLVLREQRLLALQLALNARVLVLVRGEARVNARFEALALVGDLLLVLLDHLVHLPLYLVNLLLVRAHLGRGRLEGHAHLLALRLELGLALDEFGVGGRALRVLHLRDELLDALLVRLREVCDELVVGGYLVVEAAHLADARLLLLAQPRELSDERLHLRGQALYVALHEVEASSVYLVEALLGLVEPLVEELLRVARVVACG